MIPPFSALRRDGIINRIRGEIDRRRDLEAHSAAVQADRQWAEQQAQRQMDFQERMSSTAYQRAVTDMQAAGLNPALAYMQGGASSASGSQAQTSSTEQSAILQAMRDNAALNREMLRANSAMQREQLRGITEIFRDFISR